MLIRISCLIPIFSSLAALSLSIVVLTAGSTTSHGQDTFWLSLNTSKVGQDLIQLTPVTGLDDPVGGFLGGIIDGIISNITVAIDRGIQDLQGEIVGNLTRALGIKDVYRLFLTKVCEGDFADAIDPNSAVRITSCVPYSESSQGLLNITRAIPNHFIVGATNVSVPLVSALGSTFMGAASLAVTGSEAMFVLAVIGAASSGICAIGSAALILANPRYLALATLGWSILAEISLMVLAISTTGIILGGSQSVAGLGAAINLETNPGRKFLELVWIAAGFSVLAAKYWLAVWFVDFRTSSFKRRRRELYEIGSWRGIWGEVKDDLRISHMRKFR